MSWGEASALPASLKEAGNLAPVRPPLQEAAIMTYMRHANIVSFYALCLVPPCIVTGEASQLRQPLEPFWLRAGWPSERRCLVLKRPATWAPKRTPAPAPARPFSLPLQSCVRMARCSTSCTRPPRTPNSPRS